MITIAIMLLGLAIFLFSLKAAAPKLKEASEKSDSGVWVGTALFWKIATVPLIIIIFAFANPLTVERVDAGHVGVKFNMTGDNRGISRYEYKSGWVIYNTWISRLYEFPTFQQHVDFDEQDIITKGGFRTKIKPSFNYTLKAGEIGDMFQNLRVSLKELEKGWLYNAIISSVNDVANRWTVDSIFNYREGFEANIVAEANKRTQRWFIMSQLRTNITPPEAITESILAKTKAIQEVQVAENQKLVAIAEAQRKMAEARGDSAQAVIQASGRAVSMKVEQEAAQKFLTPLYVDYLRVQKWDGKMPLYTTSGNGGGFLMNLGTPNK